MSQYLAKSLSKSIHTEIREVHRVELSFLRDSLERVQPMLSRALLIPQRILITLKRALGIRRHCRLFFLARKTTVFLLFSLRFLSLLYAQNKNTF